MRNACAFCLDEGVKITSWPRLGRQQPAEVVAAQQATHYLPYSLRLISGS
jgi:hypothetical protein